MDHLLVCNCGEVMVKSANGTTKIRAKIIVFRGDQAYAVCKGCGKELSAPISLNKDEILSKSKSPKLFIKGS